MPSWVSSNKRRPEIRQTLEAISKVPTCARVSLGYV